MDADIEVPVQHNAATIRLGDRLPVAVTIAVHALNLNANSRVRPALVAFALGAARHHIPVTPYAQSVTIGLSFHRLVFDSLKVDVLERGFVVKRRIASARLRISRKLPAFSGSYIHTVSLLDPHAQREIIGTIDLLFSFTDGDESSCAGESGISTAVANDGSLVDDDGNMSDVSDCEDSADGDDDDVSDRPSPVTSENTKVTAMLGLLDGPLAASKTLPTPDSSLSSESPSGSSASDASTFNDSPAPLTAATTATSTNSPARIRILTARHILAPITSALNTPQTMHLQSATTSSRASFSSSVRTNNNTISRRRNVFGITDHTRNVLAEITEITSAFFGTGWRISKAEATSAFYLLNEYYRRHPTPRTHDVITDETHMRIAAYFMDYALVTYGATAMNFFGYGRGYLRDIVRINPNRKMAVSHLGIASKDILAWEFGAPELYKPNFFIAHDARTESIIVSIRGTFNIHECIVDLNTEYVKFGDGFTHKGFFMMARWIEDNYLERILEWVRVHQAKAVYFVGHSLGGSTASLLLINCLDRIRATGPPGLSVRVYNYGGPPCISRHVSDRFSDLIDSYVNENDIVPRISYGGFLDLRDLIITASDLIKRPELSTDDRLDIIHKQHTQLRADNTHPRIHVPGRIFYMYKTSRVHTATSAKAIKKRLVGSPDTMVGHALVDHPTPHYVMEQSDADAFDFHIRPNMIFHHLVNKYNNSLRESHDWIVDWKKNNPVLS